MTMTGPVCDAGRCAQVLAAFAVVRERATERLASELAVALERVAERLGHDPNDPAVRAVIAEELQALAGDRKTIEGTVAV